jgi:hypothetical protein
MGKKNRELGEKGKKRLKENKKSKNLKREIGMKRRYGAT